MSFSSAAAFVEMVLEAGVQLFEGRPFAIEDFEIRKPLILPDPSSAMVLEMTYEPAERTFTIQSKFEQAASWLVHVVGSMRSERTESSFAASEWQGPGTEMKQEDVGESYGAMSDSFATVVTPRANRRRRKSQAESPCPRRSESGPLKMRCIQSCSTVRCMCSPQAQRQSRIGARR